MGRWLGVSFVSVLLAAMSSCGGGLPTDHGVTWGCTGEVKILIGPTEIPAAFYSGCPPPPGSGIDVFTVTVFANPDVPQEQVMAECNSTCTGSFASYATAHQITLDGPIQCTTISAAPCEAIAASLDEMTSPSGVQYMSGGPADYHQALSGSITLNVDGDTATVGASGIVGYSIGKGCEGNNCDFQMSLLSLNATEAFELQGLNVTSASVNNLGMVFGTAAPGTVEVLPDFLIGQTNFVVGGQPASQALPNDTAIVGALVPGQSLSLSGQLGSGPQTVNFSVVGGTVFGRPPIAEFSPAAGATVACTSPAGATVALTSTSTDPDNDITAFVWNVDGVSQPVSSAVLNKSLGFGSHTVRHTVVDGRGAMSQATHAFTVADITPPVFTFVPPPIVVSDCTAPSIGIATAVDACGGAVTITNNAPAKFPLGQTTVTWTARDSAGNTTLASQVVTAVLGSDPSCCPQGTHLIQGSSNNDNIIGTSDADCILGNGGQDTIAGGGGNDFISGGDGNDTVDGGSGNDMIFGGSGQDVLRGGLGNDTLRGEDGDDQCFGGDGLDILSGGQGQDQLNGEGGDDQIFGDDGDDTLNGGLGNDLLNGGGLHDVCIGGGGTNTFVSCEQQQ